MRARPSKDGRPAHPLDAAWYPSLIRGMSLQDVRVAIAVAGLLALFWRMRLHGDIEASWGYILASAWIAQYFVQFLSRPTFERPVRRPAGMHPTPAGAEEQVWPASAKSLVVSLSELHGVIGTQLEPLHFSSDEARQARESRRAKVRTGIVIAGVMTLFWYAPSLTTTLALLGWAAVVFVAAMAGVARARALRFGSEVIIESDAVTVRSSAGATRLRYGDELRVVYLPIFGRWELHRLDSSSAIVIDTARDHAEEILGQIFRRANFVRSS